MKPTTVTNEKVQVKNPSKFRLAIMRGLYLLTFIGLAFQAWEYLLFPGEQIDYITGVAFSFWATYATLMGLGVRYPIKMLPLLFLQLMYKATWVLTVYLPMKSSGTVTPVAESFYWICITAVILDVLVIPWGYFWKSYVRPFLNFKAHPA